MGGDVVMVGGACSVLGCGDGRRDFLPHLIVYSVLIMSVVTWQNVNSC